MAQAKKIGICLTPDDIINCEIDTNDSLLDEILEEPDENEFNINDPNENKENDSTAESHRNVEVLDIDGSVKIIPKSTLIWMLTESKDKLSSDRLKRVQGSASKPSFKRIKLDQSNVSSTVPTIFKSDQLKITEWAIFKGNDVQNHSGIRDYKIGLITGFKIFEKKSSEKGRWKQYKLHYIPINTETNQTMSKKLRLELGFDTNLNEIHVLGVFYTCDEKGILSPNGDIDKFPLKNYVATIEKSKTRKDDNSNNIVYTLPCEYPELIRLATELNKEASTKTTTASENC